MGNNSQSRKWSLVINNPLEAGLDHTAISEKLHLFSPDYYCMADEIATTGTYHTHVFFYAPSPSRFSTVKKRFPILPPFFPATVPVAGKFVDATGPTCYN